MPDDLQAQYDDAMFAFSQGDYDTAIAGLRAVLAADPAHFDAQLSLGMAWCRKGDFATAIAEGHKAEQMRPHEQLVHTNLSLFYMRSGNKVTAEHHGLQARIASWKGNMAAPGATPAAPSDPELELAKPAPQSFKLPEKFPDQPWKKNKKVGEPPAQT
jgi:Flp pilus assembly protein TadD